MHFILIEQQLQLHLALREHCHCLETRRPAKQYCCHCIVTEHVILKSHAALAVLLSSTSCPEQDIHDQTDNDDPADVNGERLHRYDGRLLGHDEVGHGDP